MVKEGIKQVLLRQDILVSFVFENMSTATKVTLNQIPSL